MLDGTNVINETVTENGVDKYTLYYLYDSSGIITGFIYNNNPFYFQKNLQGDIVRILNPAGAVVTEYTYDAWGNVLSITGSLASTVGQINPFRYRGYYYDTETGFYYLQSRYYDPTVCRFLNADSFVSTGQGILGNNMFAYCGNDSVNSVDYTGQFWNEICEFIDTVIVEIEKSMASMAPAYAVCGGATVADGPLPFGDVIAIAGATIITAGVIGYSVCKATETIAIHTSKSEEKSVDKAIDDVMDDLIPMPIDSPVVFPLDPNSFNPCGLIKVYRVGTKNGSFISWMEPSTNTEVFRWDENPNYVNGAHYHIFGEGHYYPGDVVPEPFATIYFPFG